MERSGAGGRNRHGVQASRAEPNPPRTGPAASRRRRSSDGATGDSLAGRSGGRDRDARQLRQRHTRRRERVIDPFLKVRVAAVEGGPKLRRPAEVGARSEDAEAATEPRHARGIGPVRGLAGPADDAKDIVGLKRMNRAASRTSAARPCSCERCAARPGVSGAGRAFRCPHAHGADKKVAESRMGLEVTSQFPLDGRSLEIRRTPSRRRRREPPAFLDPLEQGLARGERRQDERHAIGDRASRCARSCRAIRPRPAAHGRPGAARAGRCARAGSSCTGCPCRRSDCYVEINIAITMVSRWLCRVHPPTP